MICSAVSTPLRTSLLSLRTSSMALHTAGLVVMAAFYLLVMGVGLWASVRSRRMKKSSLSSQMEVSFLANRRVTLAVGVFTMTGRQEVDFRSLDTS